MPFDFENFRTFTRSIEARLKFATLVSRRVQRREPPDFEKDLNIVAGYLSLGGARILTPAVLREEIRKLTYNKTMTTAWEQKIIDKGLEILEKLEKKMDEGTKLAAYVGAYYFIALIKQAGIMWYPSEDREYIVRVFNEFSSFLEELAMVGYKESGGSELL